MTLQFQRCSSMSCWTLDQPLMTIQAVVGGYISRESKKSLSHISSWDRQEAGHNFPIHYSSSVPTGNDVAC